MAKLVDFLSPWRRAPGPWSRRPEPNWHHRPAQQRSLAERFALVLGFFALGGVLAYAAANYDLASIQAALAPERQEAPEPYRPAPAPAVRYSAVDGDSLRAGREDVRLLGIDAPELFQTCRDGRGREWACGRAARDRLAALVAGGRVRCTSEGQDRYGRTLARCSAGPVGDIGETMIREGLAVDFMSGGYGGAEAEARAARRGIWAGSFERPQEWRRRNPRRTQAN